MAPTIGPCFPARHIPDAQLITCPDSGNGFLFQYPALLVAHAARFPDPDAAFT